MKNALFGRLLVAAVCLWACCCAAFADINVTNEAELFALSGEELGENVNIAPGTYDMSSYNWRCISVLDQGCVLNGNGAVITGLSETFLSDNWGTITNLTVKVSSDLDIDIDYANYAGISYFNYGDIENCVVYSEDAVISADGSSTILAGICTYNDNEGAIRDCMVSGLYFLPKGDAQTVGGIVGANNGDIERCSVFDTIIDAFLAENDDYLHTYIGFLIGNDNGGELTASSAEGCLAMARGGFVGGIAGAAMDYNPINICACRVKNCDIIYGNYTGYGSMGGLVGRFYSDGNAKIEGCYFGGKTNQGLFLEWGIAGGLFGEFLCQGQIGARNCYYDTDYADGITGIMGAGDWNMTDHCEGYTDDYMKGPDFPYLLGADWQEVTDDYPVYSDGNYKRLIIARPSKDNVPLSKNIYKVEIAGLNEYALVMGDAVIDYSDLLLTDVIGDGTDITVDSFTVNGADVPEGVDVDLSGLEDTVTISARVTNNTAQALQDTVNKYRGIYQRGLRMFTPSSLATLKIAIDTAQAVLDDHFINVTKTEADPLADAMETTALDVLVCSVTFTSEGSGHVTDYFTGETVTDYVAEKNTSNWFTAVPDSGSSFVCWRDSAGNILGEDENMEYTVTRTTEVTAVFRPADAFTFTYKDKYGKIYKVQQASDFSEISYPYPVDSRAMRVGYRVDSWTSDYPGEMSGEVTCDVTFTAQLKRVDGEEYDVRYKTDQNDTSWMTRSVKPGGVFETTAKNDMDGAPFAYWKDGSGNVVSFNKTISVTVYSEMELTPWYLDETPDALTVANLQTPVVYAGTGKISFPAQYVEGDDFDSLIYCGVLLLKSNTAVTDLNFGTPGVIVGKSNGVSQFTKSFIINKKNVSQGDTWYGRAFAVYTDHDGELQIAFSDIKGATMN